MNSPNESMSSPAASSEFAGVALPEPGGFDAHTHMDIVGLPVDGLLASAAAAGIKRVVNVGCDLPSSRWSVSCAEEYPDVYAAVAIHPNETSALDAGREDVLAEVSALAQSPRGVGLGEGGRAHPPD